MSPVYFGTAELMGVSHDEMKSRHACAERGCDRGPSVGYDIHRVSADGERFKGYCAEHLADEPCRSTNHVCDLKAAS